MGGVKKQIIIPGRVRRGGFAIPVSDETHALAVLAAHEAMLDIRETRGARVRIAGVIKKKTQTVDAWKTVPIEYLFQVAEVMQKDAVLLRPDFFLRDPKRIKDALKIALRARRKHRPKLLRKLSRLKGKVSPDQGEPQCESHSPAVVAATAAVSATITPGRKSETASPA